MDDLDKRILEILAKQGQPNYREPTSNSDLPKILEGIDVYYGYTSQEVASILSREQHTITRWCRNGKMRATQATGYKAKWVIYGDEIKRVILKDMRKPSFLDGLLKKTNEDEDEDE